MIEILKNIEAELAKIATIIEDCFENRCSHDDALGAIDAKVTDLQAVVAPVTASPDTHAPTETPQQV